MNSYDITSSLKKEDARKCKVVQLGVFQDKVTEEFEDTIYRLLKILQSKEESKILGVSILKEIFYRIASGENAHFLHKMFLNYKQEAKNEDMSISSFHNHFKNITSYSPLQYIKKIRLNKAKNLIEQKNLQINNTAYAVGYESASQFSRDFKTYFGYPPKEAKIAL